MGRFRACGRHAMQRRAGHHPANRFMVMIMVRGERGRLLSRSIPLEIFPDRAERRPPHVTLYGPFTLSRGHTPQDIMNCIAHFCRDKSPLGYGVSGLTGLQGRKGEALALEISPDHEMKEFYDLLSNRLRTMAKRSTWIDRHPELRRLHITLLFNMRAGEAARIREQIMEPLTDAGIHTATRIAVVRNGALWYEYNLIGHQWLNRAASFAMKE
jgi:hypothetical protein